MKNIFRSIIASTVLLGIVIAALLIAGCGANKAIAAAGLSLKDFPQYWEQVKKQYPADARFFVSDSFGVDMEANKDGAVQFLVLEYTVIRKDADDARIVQMNYRALNGSGSIRLSDTAKLPYGEADRTVEMDSIAELLSGISANEDLMDLIKGKGFSLQYGWPFEPGTQQPFKKSAGRIFAVDGGVTTEIQDDENDIVAKKALGVLLFDGVEVPAGQGRSPIQVVYYLSADNTQQ